MRLHKTEKARNVLQAQGLVLSPAERRILILCDGQRTRRDLLVMLGGDVAGSIEILVAQGYLIVESSPARLAAATSAANSTAGMAGRLFGRLRGSQASMEPATDTPAGNTVIHAVAPPASATSAAALPATTQPPASAPGSRRSMSAAKMYMLDMLQLQRSVESASIAVVIQTSRDEHELADAFLEALACLHANAKSSVSARVAQRLLEVLPEAQLGHVQTGWLALTSPPLTAEEMSDQPAQGLLADNVIRLRRGTAA